MVRGSPHSPHPYLFFNADGHSFTFMGFIINPVNGDILEPATYRILAAQVMPKVLQDALVRNMVNLREEFDALPRFGLLLFFFLISPFGEEMFLRNTSGDAPLHQRMVAGVVPS